LALLHRRQPLPELGWLARRGLLELLQHLLWPELPLQPLLLLLVLDFSELWVLVQPSLRALDLAQELASVVESPLPLPPAPC
jgi:hypothetical protein